MPESFPVTLHVYKDPETGVTHVLPDALDLEVWEKRIQRDEEHMKRLAGDKKRAAEFERFQATCRAQREALQDTVTGREDLIPKSEAKNYELFEIGLNDLWEAEEAAKVETEDGMRVVDNSKLMRMLLPKSVKGMSDDAVKALAPVIGTKLWDKLFRAIYPDNDTLFFRHSSSRSS